MSSRVLQLLLSFLLVAMPALAAASCGGADPTPSPAASPGSQQAAVAAAPDQKTVRSLNRLAQIRGHLEISKAAAEAADWTAAAAHAAHPVAEYWTLVEPVLAEKGVAETVRAALDSYSQSVIRQAPDWRQANDGAIATVKQAMGQIGGAGWNEAALQGAVVRELMEGVEDEYGEAVVGTALRELDEYQDAWGFFQVAKQLYSSIDETVGEKDSEAAAEIRHELEKLDEAFDSINPVQATPPEEVEEAVDEVRAELAKALGLGAADVGGPEGTVAAIRDMMAKALEEYREGKYDEAHEFAANAYLEGFEHIEGDLIQNGRMDLVEDLELKFKDLRDGIQAKKPLAELESLEGEINERLDQALEVLG